MRLGTTHSTLISQRHNLILRPGNYAQPDRKNEKIDVLPEQKYAMFKYQDDTWALVTAPWHTFTLEF